MHNVLAFWNACLYVVCIKNDFENSSDCAVVSTFGDNQELCRSTHLWGPQPSCAGIYTRDRCVTHYHRDCDWWRSVCQNLPLFTYFHITQDEKKKYRTYKNHVLITKMVTVPLRILITPNPTVKVSIRDSYSLKIQRKRPTGTYKILSKKSFMLLFRLPIRFSVAEFCYNLLKLCCLLQIDISS